MQEKKELTIYTSVCNKSNKMSDYDFRHENKTLYLTNKITKEVDFVILEVNPHYPKRYLFLTKLLLLSNFTSSKYYTISDLKVRFEDVKMKNKFKSLKNKTNSRLKKNSEIIVITNDSINQTSTETSIISVNNNSENSLKDENDIELSSSSKNLKKRQVNTIRKTRIQTKLSSRNKISTVRNL
ncbi:MAG: hypothetical protein ACOYMA_18625 [Bacteroidia bacterium]